MVWKLGMSKKLINIILVNKGFETGYRFFDTISDDRFSKICGESGQRVYRQFRNARADSYDLDFARKICKDGNCKINIVYGLADAVEQKYDKDMRG